MERPSRSLRKLPGRLSDERSRSRGRTQDSDFVVEPVSTKSPKSKLLKEKKSPGRRSRSRSAGRKKTVPKRYVEEKEYVPNSKPVKKKAASPPRHNVISRIKESIESVRNSISPEVEEVVRRSVSRFDEAKTEAIRSLTPRASTLTISTRSSSFRQRSIENNINSINDFEEKEEYIEESSYKNHIDVKKTETEREAEEEKRGGGLAWTLALVVAAGLLVISALLSRLVCTKDDCRLILPTKEKVLNYEQYFDRHIWLMYSVSGLLLFAASHFYYNRIKRKPMVSILGVACVLIVASGLGCWQHNFNGLKDLDPLPLLSATLFHLFILIALAAFGSRTLLGVSIDLFVERASALLMIVLVSQVCGVEYSRVPGERGVFLTALGLLSLPLDSLIFEPLPKQRPSSHPLSLLYTALSPFIFSLPLVYLSANKVSVNIWLLGAALAVNFISYGFYRICLWMKAAHLKDSYSKEKIKNSCYGEYSGGPWRRLRHPDLLGRFLHETSGALMAYPSPASWPLPALSLLTTAVSARRRDLQAHPAYLRTVRYSLLPPVY